MPRVVWARKPITRCGHLHKFFHGEQLLCPARCGQDRPPSGLEGSFDRSGHQQNLAPASVGTSLRGVQIRYSRGGDFLLPLDASLITCWYVATMNFARLRIISFLVGVLLPVPLHAATSPSSPDLVG